jgi:hypothetical protein
MTADGNVQVQFVMFKSLFVNISYTIVLLYLFILLHLLSDQILTRTNFKSQNEHLCIIPLALSMS